MASAALLKQGSRGDEVGSLQQNLGQLGFSLEADGIFGPATENAVEELQSAFGYDIDGIVGPGTAGLIQKQVEYGWNITGADAIKRALEAQGKKTEKGSLAGADLKRNLKTGLKGGDVAYLQRRLNVLGYNCEVNGSFDTQTDAAVRQLQGAFNYTVDGIVGSGTHTLINAQIGHGHQAN